MIILITGSTHTGKTNLAQQLLEKTRYPYLSQDHLKMGLIRSGQTQLTVNSDELLTPYLWNITKEIVKTAIENKQHLIIEGLYIPFDWQKDFTADYLLNIHFICLVMSQDYITHHFEDILHNANVIEKRLDEFDLTKEKLIQKNAYNLKMCEAYRLDYVLIEANYKATMENVLQQLLDKRGN